MALHEHEPRITALMLPVPERRNSPELLDMPGDTYSHKELFGSLADIRTVNRYLGDICAVLEHISTVAEGLPQGPEGRVLTVLDAATGSADIPVAIVKWARKRGLDIRVTGVDLNPVIVNHAKEQTAGYPEITVVAADALNLPFRDSSFDLVLCTKTLHHFTEDEAALLIKRLSRVARVGYIYIDIRRSWVAFLLIYILTRLFTRNRLTRYDGPLSVLRSFTCGELEGLAVRAGLSGFRVVKHPFWRIALIGEC